MKKIIILIGLSALLSCSKSNECIECIQTTTNKTIHVTKYMENDVMCGGYEILRADSTEALIATFCDVTDYEVTVLIPQYEVDNTTTYRENVIVKVSMPYGKWLEDYQYDEIKKVTTCK